MTDETPEIDPAWENDLNDFLKEAAASMSNQAALLRPEFFEVGLGESITMPGHKFLTIFIKNSPDEQGYILSLCMDQDGAEKMIQGLVAGYRHLYAEDHGDL